MLLGTMLVHLLLEGLSRKQISATSWVVKGLQFLLTWGQRRWVDCWLVGWRGCGIVILFFVVIVIVVAIVARVCFFVVVIVGKITKITTADDIAELR